MLFASSFQRDKLFTQKFHILSVKSEIKNFFETWNNENALLQLILGFGVFHTSHFFSTLSEHQRLGFCKWVQRVYQFASLQKPWRKGIALWPLFTNQNSLVTLRSLCTIFLQPFFSGPEVSVQTSDGNQKPRDRKPASDINHIWIGDWLLCNCVTYYNHLQ